MPETAVTVADSGANVVLVGMPGAGKSTAGARLAERLRLAFLDTDTLLEQHERLPLQRILEREGVDGFRRLEERVVCGLDCRRTVVATGGSVIYGDAAMRRLREGGVVVYLDVPLDELQRRVTDMATRGLVRRSDQDLRDLYAERLPLYLAWADIRVECATAGRDEVCSKVVAALDACGGAIARRFRS